MPSLDYDWLETNTLGIAGGPGSDSELGHSVAITGYTTPDSTPYGFAGAPGRFAGIADACRVQIYVGDVIVANGFDPIE